MNPVTPPPEDGAIVPPEAPQTSARTDFNSLPSDVQAYIKSLRDEAKQTRLEKEAVEKQRLKDESARLEAAKEWEQLAQQRAAKLAEVEPKAAELEAMQQFLQEQVDRRIAALPEQWRSAVPEEYTNPRSILAWLDKNERLFRAQTPPNIGAGTQPGALTNGANAHGQPSANFLAMQLKIGRTAQQAQASWDRLTTEQQKAAT